MGALDEKLSGGKGRGYHHCKRTDKGSMGWSINKVGHTDHFYIFEKHRCVVRNYISFLQQEEGLFDYFLKDSSGMIWVGFLSHILRYH